MLCLKRKSTGNRELIFHCIVGEDKHKKIDFLYFPVEDDDITDITLIQADGHELELIRDSFLNLPMSKGRVVSWRGPLAQFIFDNLPYAL